MPAEPTSSSLRRAWRAPFAAAALALCLLPFVASAASAASATFKGSSLDGEVVFFESEDQLVSGDTDTKRDVYARAFDSVVGDYVTRQVSLGPTGGTDAYGALFEKADTLGAKVFFSTEESLVADDTDHRADVYMRDLGSGTTLLVSQGDEDCAPGCGNGGFDAGFAGASADGTRAFFVTDESLSALDTDKSSDVYVRDLEPSESTGLVSVGGNAEIDASSRGLSADGSWAYFTTAESLVGADTDAAVDIYARDLTDGITSLVSQGGGGCGVGCGNSGAVPVFQRSSDSGTRVFFTTDEPLVGADTDTATDVYARDLPGGPTFLISAGSSSVLTASFASASADGLHVFFTTAESLDEDDEDSANDVYEWSGGALTLVTSAACSSACGAIFDAASADSATVVFSTAEQLSGADTDSGVDVYSQEVGGGAPLLISRQDSGCGGCGGGNADARFNRASADAEHVVFTSSETLASDDGDGEDDIYARDVAGDETSLVTTSPSYCPLKKGNCGATFVGASLDGLHVFFTTVERFTLEDGDNEVDVYERFLGEAPGEKVTRLVSTGNSPDLELGPAAPDLEGTDPPSPAPSTKPKILGTAEPGARIKLYATSNCSGEPVATGTAEQLDDPGIGVGVEPGSTTSFRATAEAEGFVSSCSAALTYSQEDAPSGGGGGTGGGSGSGAGSKKGGASSVIEVGAAFVAPRTRITFAPGAKTRKRNPVFRFTDSTGQAGTSFTCKLDRKPWKACGSPLRLKRLSRGRHVLAIKGVNAVGTAEAQPVKRAFKLVPR